MPQGKPCRGHKRVTAGAHPLPVLEAIVLQRLGVVREVEERVRVLGRELYAPARSLKAGRLARWKPISLLAVLQQQLHTAQ